MKNKNLIWIGVGAIALYLILRKKSIPKPIEIPKPLTSTLPLPLQDFKLQDPWLKRKGLPIVNPKPKNDSNAMPKNPYLDKTCDELKAMRENDMVSKIAPPTDLEELKKWEIDKKYKEVAYQKCIF